MLVSEACPRTLVAQDPAAETGLEMLESTWANRLEFREKADALFLAADAQNDSDLAYAYLLTKIRQADYRDAIKAANHLLDVNPDHTGGHRARTWLLLLTRQQSSALAALQSYDEANDKLDEASLERAENLRAIGRMHGYLAGPSADAISEANLDTVRNAILDGAGEAEIDLFVEQSNGVIDRFNAIIEKKEVTDAGLLDEAKKEQVTELENLEAESKKLEVRQAELQPAIDQTEKEASAAIAKIESRALPLQANLQELSSQAQAIQIDLNEVILDAQNYERLAARERDPDLRQRYLIRADRLRSLANRYEFSLDGLYRQIRSVGAALEAVQLELLNTQARYNAQLNRLNQELGNTVKKQKQNEGQTRRVSKPVRVTGGISKALENRAGSIKTYENFPIELERQKLVERLEARLKK
jgi:predicted  nucleic acid-binding Zn-ribbon protein